MSKFFHSILFYGIIVLIPAYLSSPQNTFAESEDQMEVCDIFFTGDIILLDVPIARTITQQQRGLSEKKEPGEGMIFIWDKPEPRAVWMHDTSFDLSAGFVSGDGILFSIEDMKANTDDFHLSMEPAKYVLELPKGHFKTKNLYEGSKLLRLVCKKKTLQTTKRE